MDETALAIGQLQAAVEALRNEQAATRHELVRLSEQVSDLMAVKNRGWGLLAGVSLLAAAVGNQASHLIDAIIQGAAK